MELGDSKRTWHRWGEPAAVGLNLAYTIGYQFQSNWTFESAGLGSILFMLICWQRALKAEALLWLFYVGMAIYGTTKVEAGWPDPLPVAPLYEHLISLAIGSVIWAGLTIFLRQKSWKPSLDSFTTAGSLVATYWMLEFVHANWLYWIVINAAATWLYVSRKLYWGAGLFVVYTLLALNGWFGWVA
ncbi:MAG: nicotinamide mononucleotide transporter family protein [Flavobacteriales bacterium]